MVTLKYSCVWEIRFGPWPFTKGTFWCIILKIWNPKCSQRRWRRKTKEERTKKRKKKGKEKEVKKTSRRMTIDNVSEKNKNNCGKLFKKNLLFVKVEHPLCFSPEPSEYLMSIGHIKILFFYRYLYCLNRPKEHFWHNIPLVYQLLFLKKYLQVDYSSLYLSWNYSVVNIWDYL